MRGANKRQVTILGSTGSIGCSTLAVIAEASDKYQVNALAAGGNWKGLAQQALAHNPKYVAIFDEAGYAPLKDALAHLPIAVSAGEAAVSALAAQPCDVVVGAIVGAAGIPSAIAALEAGNTLALANKESMVCAGPLLRKIAHENGARILPVDSEHNAVFQAMEDGRFVDSITITASGGPFLHTPIDALADVTPARAIKHPKWAMGPKNSIDSATMMNKALELAEAVYLFDLPHDKIDVLIHPQALIHGMAHFCDGSTLAHLCEPDMRVPIAHALAWPERTRVSVPKLDLAAAQKLEFFTVDPMRFPALDLMRAALGLGQAGPIVFNAANEVAVEYFVQGRCSFLDIVRVVDCTLETFNFHDGAGKAKSSLNLAEISTIDLLAREKTARILSVQTDQP